MINSISINKVASFDASGVRVTDLKKINFIYGANGSGKTTISNLVANPDNQDYQECSVNWQHGMSLKTLVYNKQFRDHNFGRGKIEGVFTLGQATKAEIEVIEQKQAELALLKTEGIKKKETKEKQEEKKTTEESSFKEHVWKNIYKIYETNFKEAFKGFITKEKFKNKLLLEYEDNDSPLLTIDSLQEKAKTIFGKAPETCPLINSISYDRLSEIENEKIWNKKIIGKSDADIANMIQRLNLNDWVNQGRAFLQKDDNTCPFCQQPTISDSFRKQLEEYFDETFTTSVKKIGSLNDAYLQLFQNIINELSLIETNEKAKKESYLNIDTFSAYLKTAESQFISNKELLSSKIKEPSRSIKLVSSEKQLKSIAELILKANKKIREHNEIVANYQTERNDLIRSIWKYLVEEFKEDIRKHLKKTSGLQKGIDCLAKDVLKKRQKWTDLNNEIKELTQNVTSIQPTIDQINTTLKAYGFVNFEIVPSREDKNHYQIKREDGTSAESTLSEGEITFITFLYFMQLAKGSTDEKTITDDRILVVDDPISSLDSNVLFVVSTLLKNLIREIKNGETNIKQLILLTHNVYFHKEVSFIDGRSNGDADTFYWILRKIDKTSSVQPFGMKNPIQTSYELLWQELKDKEKNSGVTIQNTMRRIIENYFKILGKYGDDDLISQFTSKEEQEICRSLICWINDGSHSISDDLYIESPADTIDKYLKVFKDIFKLTRHEGHYNMMMGLEA